ncbi:hypothetical protein [Sphingomonas sp. AOB5]|uniref:hypothetical protein n=1 Tax=Sphingomonas sp. AOB5 TaxID=3034017 RepID=UPI0023F81CE4|nr:hypothetical protein [Sphingomonas sp. AOB5]
MEKVGHKETLTTPGVAGAEQGKVILDGPDGVAITMTPAAAEGTARSLLAAAEEARHQEDEA